MSRLMALALARAQFRRRRLGSAEGALPGGEDRDLSALGGGDAGDGGDGDLSIGRPSDMLPNGDSGVALPGAPPAGTSSSTK